MRVYLVRHSEVKGNVEHFIPAKDDSLQEVGKKQAEVLAERFAHIALDKIITSDFLRTQQTAQPTAEQKSLVADTQTFFGEYVEPSSLNGLSESSDEVLEYRRERNNSHDTNPDWKYEDGESLTNFFARIKSGKNLLEDLNVEQVLVVSHSIFIRGFIIALIMNSEAPNSSWFKGIFSLTLNNTGGNCFGRHRRSLENYYN